VVGEEVEKEELMIIKIENKAYEFEEVRLKIQYSDTYKNVFYRKNNKTLEQTFDNGKYARYAKEFKKQYSQHLQERLGDFLRSLKENRDNNYLEFLNENGDKAFCQFSIETHLKDKGLYCFAVNDSVKYVGRCTDSFKKRINQGYGRISPKNCFIDGQSTNCRINSLINLESNVKFGVYVMNDSTKEEIGELEKMMINSNTNFIWNIKHQKKNDLHKRL